MNHSIFQQNLGGNHQQNFPNMQTNQTPMLKKTTKKNFKPKMKGQRSMYNDDDSAVKEKKQPCTV